MALRGGEGVDVSVRVLGGVDRVRAAPLLVLLSGSTAQSSFDSIEDAHQETGGDDGLGGFGDVVVVHVAMARRVAEGGVRAGEQHARAFLLASHGVGVGEGAGRTEGAVHEVDSCGVLTEFGEFADAHLDCLHRHEDGLLVLAEEELPATSTFDRGVHALVEACRCPCDQGRP